MSNIKPHTKIFFLLTTAFLFLSLMSSISGLDWGNNLVIPAAYLALFFAVVVSLFSRKNAFLLIIALLPCFFNFNEYKFNLFETLPFFDIGLMVNPASLAYVLIIFLSSASILERWERIKTMPLRILILFICVWSFISLGWSIDRHLSFIEFIYLLTPFFAYTFSYLELNKARDLFRLNVFIIISSFIPLASAVWQSASKVYFYEYASSLGRLTGVFAHPNSLGIYTVIVLSLVFIMYFSLANKNKFLKTALIGYSLPLLYVLAFSYSRVSWAALAIFLLIFSFAQKYARIILAGASPLVILAGLSIDSIQRRIMEVFSGAAISSWSARTRLWSLSVSEIMKRPILGFGVGASEKQIENAKTWIGGSSLPHNDYLLYFLELGAIGFGLLIAYSLAALYYILKCWKNLAKKPQKIKIFFRRASFGKKTYAFGIFSLFTALLFAGIFESITQKQIPQILIWALLGSLFAAGNLSEKKEPA